MQIIQWLSDIDTAFFLWINVKLSNPIFDWFMPKITNSDNWIVHGILLIAWLIIYGKKRGRIAVLLLLITIGLTDSLAAQIIKPIVGRIRPSHSMPEMINLLVSRGGKLSFVSNHAANMFALSVILGYFYASLRPWITLLAGMIAFSRVYVGVHYPADAIFGGLFGYTIAWGVLSLWVTVKMRELKRGRMWVWYDDIPRAD